MRNYLSKWLVGVAILAHAALGHAAQNPTSYPEPIFYVTGYGTCNQASLLAATTDCASAGTGRVVLPAGTCTMTAGVTLPGLSSCTIEGAGREATILDCSTVVGDCITSGTVANTYTLKDMTIKGALTGGATPNAVKVRKVDRGVRIENVNFDVTTGNAIYCNGCTDFKVSGGTWYSDGAFQTTTEKPRGLYVDQGADDVAVDSVRAEYLYDAFYLVGSATSPVRNLRISRSTIDGGAWSNKARHTNSGGTVTYNSTSVTDSSAPFTANGIAATTIVRVLTSAQAGTVTSTAGGQLTDSAATFPTSTIRGDIVRTADAFAIVEQRLSGTALSLTEWRSLTTYRPVAAPADGTAYTLYDVVLGEAANSTNSTTAITVHKWFDFAGVASTPTNGAIYEVSWHRGGYGIKSTVNVENLTIAGNLFLRGPAAATETSGAGVIFAGNTCKDGMDGCIGVQGGGRATITGNLSDHTGFGIALYGGSAGTGNRNVVSDNVIRDAHWTSKGNPPTYSMYPIVIRSSDENVIEGNVLEKGALKTSNTEYGIFIDDDPVSSAGDDSTNNLITGNQVLGFDTAGVRLVDADAAGTSFRATMGTTFSDGGATGTTVDGWPLLSAPPATAAAALTGRRYWDIDLNEECVCNGTPAWVQQDGGGACS